MVLKLSSMCSMEREFELVSLEDNLKREIESVQLQQEGICCNEQVEPMQPHMQQPYPVELLCNQMQRRTNFVQEHNFHTFPPSPPPSTEDNSRIIEESMMWLATQPLDLRNSDDMDSWMMRRAAGYGDLIAPAGEDPQGGVPHLQTHGKLPHYNGSVEGSSSGSFSDDCESLADAPSPTHPPQGSHQGDGGLNDDQLIALSVRDLNRRLHGFPREVITRIKQKRRTLKNRGYAQNCRTKRIAQKCMLEKNNVSLQQERDRVRVENDRLLRENERLTAELAYYRQQAKQQLMLRQHPPAGSSPGSPEFYM